MWKQNMDVDEQNDENTSKCSTPDSVISEFCSFSYEGELNTDNVRDEDELPTFNIKSISPTGRSPSPIEITPHLNTSLLGPNEFETEIDVNDTDSVTLEDLNAQLKNSPPPLDTNRSLSLETIFEGVFFETPPKVNSQTPGHSSSRSAKSSLRCLVLEEKLRKVQTSDEPSSKRLNFSKETCLN